MSCYVIQLPNSLSHTGSTWLQEVNISKYNAIDSSCYINSKFQTGCSQIFCSLYTIYEILQNIPIVTLWFCLRKQYREISRTYQNSRSKLTTCKQLDLFLITYLHWWCNIIINNKKYSYEQNNISYLLYIHNNEYE